MSRIIKLMVAAVAVIAVVLLVYAILDGWTATEDSNHMGWGSHTYSNANMLLIIGALALIIIPVMIILLKEEYKPLPPSMAKEHENAKERPREPEGGAPPLAATERPQERVPDKEYLILRLLSGDERVMFKAIMDSGGEALQKDLILRTKMSNAKVSRLLDRLQQKGVVRKERYGSTNKVSIDPRE